MSAEGNERVLKTVEWDDETVVMIDQRRLPAEEVYLRCRDHREVAAAIKDMAIRGAPAIGVAAALGIALGVRRSRSEGDALRREFDGICEDLRVTRPTAVNLFWAIERMRRAFDAGAAAGGAGLRDALLAEARAIHAEDIAACRRMGDFGAALITRPSRVLTHCNAGALATAGYGTALGVIRSAARDGNISGVIADETRPYLQGARLTAWELQKSGIDVTVIPDAAAAFLMSRGEVSCVVVGADRIAANGDVANKIGTYALAIAARHHGVPFYVAGPRSTLDTATATGTEIAIEQRDGGELGAAAGTAVWNPAFDVTPAELVTALITDAGVLRAPYGPCITAAAAPLKQMP